MKRSLAVIFQPLSQRSFCHTLCLLETALEGLTNSPHMQTTSLQTASLSPSPHTRSSYRRESHLTGPNRHCILNTVRERSRWGCRAIAHEIAAHRHQVRQIEKGLPIALLRRGHGEGESGAELMWHIQDVENRTLCGRVIE